MNETDRAAMRRSKIERRIEAVRQDLGLLSWPRSFLNELIDRIDHVVGDDLTATDMRVIVRIFNREVVGRQRR